MSAGHLSESEETRRQREVAHQIHREDFGEDEEEDGSTVIQVSNPLNHPEPYSHFTSKVFTTYEITVRTEDKRFNLKFSCVRRRYKEFVWLRDYLKTTHYLLKPPDLPGKTWFCGPSRLDAVIIHQRCVGFETFLKKCIKMAEYMSDTCFHLFLQTSLNMTDINEVLRGGTDQTIWSLLQEELKSYAFDAGDLVPPFIQRATTTSTDEGESGNSPPVGSVMNDIPYTPNFLRALKKKKRRQRECAADYRHDDEAGHDESDEDDHTEHDRWYSPDTDARASRVYGAYTAPGALRSDSPASDDLDGAVGGDSTMSGGSGLVHPGLGIQIHISHHPEELQADDAAATFFIGSVSSAGLTSTPMISPRSDVGADPTWMERSPGAAVSSHSNRLVINEGGPGAVETIGESEEEQRSADEAPSNMTSERRIPSCLKIRAATPPNSVLNSRRASLPAELMRAKSGFHRPSPTNEGVPAKKVTFNIPRRKTFTGEKAAASNDGTNSGPNNKNEATSSEKDRHHDSTVGAHGAESKSPEEAAGSSEPTQQQQGAAAAAAAEEMSPELAEKIYNIRDIRKWRALHRYYRHYSESDTSVPPELVAKLSNSASPSAVSKAQQGTHHSPQAQQGPHHSSQAQQRPNYSAQTSSQLHKPHSGTVQRKHSGGSKKSKAKQHGKLSVQAAASTASPRPARKQVAGSNLVSEDGLVSTASAAGASQSSQDPNMDSILYGNVSTNMVRPDENVEKADEDEGEVNKDLEGDEKKEEEEEDAGPSESLVEKKQVEVRADDPPSVDGGLSIDEQPDADAAAKSSVAVSEQEAAGSGLIAARSAISPENVSETKAINEAVSLQNAETAESTELPADTLGGNTVLADPVLADPVLADPVLADTIPVGTVQTEQLEHESPTAVEETQTVKKPVHVETHAFSSTRFPTPPSSMSTLHDDDDDDDE